MRILMIAPEPFFEPRGTPFSEFHRIRALTELGHSVDLVTYPFGTDVAMRGLRVFRSARPPFVRAVKVGPSLAKIPLDFALTVTAVRCAVRGRYDAVHSHEEGSLIGVLLALALGVPHVYDMHSSLPHQLTNFGFSRSRLLNRLFSSLERGVIRRSRVVITICPHLEDVVKQVDPSARTIVIENTPGSADLGTADSSIAIRAAFGFDDATPVVVYTGTFEAYQGLDLLFGAARQVIDADPAARFLLAGGRPDQIERARTFARRAGVEQAVVFAGQRPAEEIPSFLAAADVLVSPRSTGSNTPLKIYQYLRSGKPIVATRLLTHTQVLNDEVAILTEANSEDFAAGILRALRQPEWARQIGQRARDLAETKYSYDAYLERTRLLCAQLLRTVSPQVAGGVA